MNDVAWSTLIVIGGPTIIFILLYIWVLRTPKGDWLDEPKEKVQIHSCQLPRTEFHRAGRRWQCRTCHSVHKIVWRQGSTEQYKTWVLVK